MAASPTVYTESVALPDGTVGRRQRTDATGRLGWRLRARDPRTGKQPEAIFWGDEQAAVRALADLELKLAASARTAAPPASKTTTLEQWAVTWLGEIYCWKVRPSPNGKYAGERRPFASWAKARSILNANLLPYLGDRRLTAISADALLDTIADLTLLDKNGRPTDTPLAGGSKATVANVARALFRDAVAAGLLTSSPAAHLPTTWGGESRRLALVPSLAEMEKLARALDASWKLQPWEKHLAGPNGEGNGDLVRLLALCGPRWSEVAGAQAADVNVRRRFMRVAEETASESGGRRDVQRGGQAGKSAAAKRTLTIVDPLVPVLERLRARRQAGLAAEPARAARRAVRQGRKLEAGGAVRGLNCDDVDQWARVVNGATGGYQSYGHWRKKLDVARAASGVNYTAHELRHVCASLLIASGMDAHQVAEHMGHASYRTTERIYKHLFRLDHTELARRISAGLAVLTASEIVEAEAALAEEDTAEGAFSFAGR